MRRHVFILFFRPAVYYPDFQPGPFSFHPSSTPGKVIKRSNDEIYETPLHLLPRAGRSGGFPPTRHDLASDTIALSFSFEERFALSPILCADCHCYPYP